MRDHPNIIHSAILDSVAPLQANWARDASAHLDGALTAVFRDCSANPDCARAYPRLRASLERALDRLRTDPIELELNQSTHFPSIELDQPLYAVIDDTTLLDVLHWALYYPAQVPHLPLLIHGLGKGEYWRLKFYTEGLFFDPYWSEVAIGMSFSVDCFEEFPFESREAVESAVDHYPLFRRWALRGWDYEICDIWPSGRAMPAENLPVQSNVPVLLLSGAYDPVTPPELAHAAAATLPNSYVFVFPSESHGVSFTHPCARQVAREFASNPNARPSSGCLASLKPRDFLSLGGNRERVGAASQGDERGRVD